MEIRIFNVTHGFCAYIIADNGNVMLVDCGHNQDTGFRPSTYLRNGGCTGIEQFIVSNYDEDHLSDLSNLRNVLPIQVLNRNRGVSADVLRRIKLSGGPLAPGTRALLDMMGIYTHEVVDGPEFPNIELVSFHNNYPQFSDTNNLSLVTFLHYRDIHIVFPGDLEKAGWHALLKNLTFRGHLSRVNFFVASHHGRENGYCPEVFDYCRNPALAIVSDGPIQHATQSKDNYRKHVSGIPWHNGDYRWVLTTRRDGMISIRQHPADHTSYVYTSR